MGFITERYGVGDASRMSASNCHSFGEIQMKKFCAVLSLAIVGAAVGPALRVFAADAPTTQAAKAEEHDSDEVKVAFNQLPAAVQATLTKESGGTAIKDADQETKDGKTTYEADATIGGTKYEIVVAADGTLISKKVDDESDEGKKGEKEDDEKEEHGEHKD